MTITEYKERLKQLHDLIKENPFRKDYVVNARYGKGYYNTVYEFAETFCHLIKDIKRAQLENITLENITEEDKKLAKLASGFLFTHDFYASINRSHNALYTYLNYGKAESLDIIHEEEQLMELCISCIHCYLDTGLFNRYPFRYHGSIKWAEWDDKKNDFMIDLHKKKESKEETDIEI